MEQNKEAEQAWVYQSNRRWHEKEANPKAFDDPYIQGIVDYRASLKEAIENLPDGGVINVRKKGKQALFDLIDTVKPNP